MELHFQTTNDVVAVEKVAEQHTLFNFSDLRNKGILSSLKAKVGRP